MNVLRITYEFAVERNNIIAATVKTLEKDTFEVTEWF